MRSGATVPRILFRSRSCITSFELFVIGARASWTYGGRQRGLPEASRLRVINAFTNAAHCLARRFSGSRWSGSRALCLKHLYDSSFSFNPGKQIRLAFFFLGTVHLLCSLPVEH